MTAVTMQHATYCRLCANLHLKACRLYGFDVPSIDDAAHVTSTVKIDAQIASIVWQRSALAGADAWQHSHLAV